MRSIYCARGRKKKKRNANRVNTFVGHWMRLENKRGGTGNEAITSMKFTRHKVCRFLWPITLAVAIRLIRQRQCVNSSRNPPCSRTRSVSIRDDRASIFVYLHLTVSNEAIYIIFQDERKIQHGTREYFGLDGADLSLASIFCSPNIPIERH